MLKAMRYFLGCLLVTVALGVISDGVHASEEEISSSDQVQWVAKKTAESRGIYSRVQNLLDRAREEKDTIKITCLDDKLTQIHVSLRGIEERASSMKIAQDAGDTTTAEQHFSIIKIYVSRVSGLNAEADNCLGETDIVLGKTETTVEILGDVTMEDPSNPDSAGSVENPPDPSDVSQASGFY